LRPAHGGARRLGANGVAFGTCIDRPALRPLNLDVAPHRRLSSIASSHRECEERRRTSVVGATKEESQRCQFEHETRRAIDNGHVGDQRRCEHGSGSCGRSGSPLGPTRAGRSPGRRGSPAGRGAGRDALDRARRRPRSSRPCPCRARQRAVLGRGGTVAPAPSMKSSDLRSRPRRARRHNREPNNAVQTFG
jgi:hypothetical protein